MQVSREIEGLTVKEWVMSELKRTELCRGIDTLKVPFVWRVSGAPIMIAADQCHLDLTV